MSSLYTVKPGDTWESIAKVSYGDGALWPQIFRANSRRAKRTNPTVGEELVVPSDFDLIEPVIPSGSPNEITIVSDGVKLPFMSARVIRTMDTVADAITAVIPWEYGLRPALDDILRPYSYAPVQAYIGGELVISGYLAKTNPRFGGSGSSNAITAFSFTADALDSSAPAPYEQEGVTPRRRVELYASFMGLRVEVSDAAAKQADTVYPSAISADASDKISEHLIRVLGPRGLLLSSTPRGDFLINRAGGEEQVAILQEGVDVTIDGKFNGRARWRYYKAMAQTRAEDAQTALAIDPDVPRSRAQSFRVEDTTGANIQEAANWRRSKQIVDALELKVTVPGFITPGGERWRENTSVLLIAPSLHMPKGFKLLIKSVEFESSNSGNKTTLNLIPRQAYTGEPIESPWAL